MKDKITGIIMALPELDIKPTMSNVKLLDAIYNTLLEIHDELEAKEDAGTDERIHDNPGGRDDS